MAVAYKVFGDMAQGRQAAKAAVDAGVAVNEVVLFAPQQGGAVTKQVVGTEGSFADGTRQDTSHQPHGTYATGEAASGSEPEGTFADRDGQQQKLGHGDQASFADTEFPASHAAEDLRTMLLGSGVTTDEANRVVAAMQAGGSVVVITAADGERVMSLL